MALSSGVRQARRTAQGVPVFAFERVPGLPPVIVARWGDTERGGLPHPHPDAHAHDFLVLVYIESGSGSMRVDDREWSVGPGDVVVIAPGATAVPGADDGLRGGIVWVVFFPADAVDPAGFVPLVSWRPHPLLFPFAGGSAAGGQRLRVPPADRDGWIALIEGMAAELRSRRDGYAEAVRAHLTLLLVRLARLGADVVDDLRMRDEPLLAAVFETIETRYREPISLKDVADAVGLSSGHLTTVVGDRTGRTVQQWITERRMREARRLLTGTDLTVAALAGRVGYRDVGYFIRRFRSSHGVTPAQWRRAGRGVFPLAVQEARVVP